MEDREAYELMCKYSGDEGLIKISEMVHLIGVEGAVKALCETYSEKGVELPEEFIAWMRQAISYSSNTKLKN